MNQIKAGYLKGYYFVDDPFLSGALKPGQDKATIENIKPGDVCLDIGANCGYYSLMMAKRTGAKGKVFSFEPLPGTFIILGQVIRENKIKNIIPYQTALGDEVKKSFIRGGIDGDLDACIEGEGIYLNEGNILNTNLIPVKVITIDFFIIRGGIKRLDFIKMDAQGADLLVLKGGLNTIKVFHPKIICEALGSVRRDAIIEFLTKEGYKCEVVEVTYGHNDEASSYHLLCKPE